MMILSLISVFIMLVAAALVVFLRSLLASIAAMAVVSLALAVLFALLRAPDVAIAEAAVGTGLSGVMLALTLRRVGLWPSKTDQIQQNEHDDKGDAR